MEAERCPICRVGERPEPWRWCQVCGLTHLSIRENLAWLHGSPPEAPRSASGCVRVERADAVDATHYREAPRDGSIRIDVRPRAPWAPNAAAFGVCFPLGASGALVVPSLVLDPSAPWSARAFGVLGLLATSVALWWAWWVARDMLGLWRATRITATASGLRIQTWRGLWGVREVTLQLPRVEGVVWTPTQHVSGNVWLLLQEDTAIQIAEWLRPADADALAVELQRLLPGARSPQ